MKHATSWTLIVLSKVNGKLIIIVFKQAESACVMKGLYQASSANNNIIKFCGSVGVGQIKDMQCTHGWSLASFFFYGQLLFCL